MQRAVLLQSVATRSKQNLLSKFEGCATSETNPLLSLRSEYSRFNDFWQAVGMETKKRSGFNIQVVCDIARAVWIDPVTTTYTTDPLLNTSVNYSAATATLNTAETWNPSVTDSYWAWTNTGAVV
jgi:hypothetical protein